MRSWSSRSRCAVIRGKRAYRLGRRCARDHRLRRVRPAPPARRTTSSAGRSGRAAATAGGWSPPTTRTRRRWASRRPAARSARRRRPGSIYFATTAPAVPRQDQRDRDPRGARPRARGFAVDLAGSARSARRRASRRGRRPAGWRCLADIRTGLPGSADERDGGRRRGARSLFGDGGEAAVAEVVSPGRRRPPSSSTAGALPGAVASRTVGGALRARDVHAADPRRGRRARSPTPGSSSADHVVVSSPHARAAAAAAKAARRGDPGRRARLRRRRRPRAAARGRRSTGPSPGETILIVSAADGCDAACCGRPRDQRRAAAAASVAEQLEGGRDVAYATYLDVARAARARAAAPPRARAARPARPSARAEAWKFAFVGSRCTRVRARARAAAARVRRLRGGRPDGARPARRTGRGRSPPTRSTGSRYSPSPPMIDAVVDFDGGGRYTLRADRRRARRGRDRHAARADVPPPVHGRRRPQLLLEGEADLMASLTGSRTRWRSSGWAARAFGEHWDRSADDLLIDATEECFASTPSDHARTTSTRTGSGR